MDEDEPTFQLGDVHVDASLLADLCRQYQVRELSLFGSAVRGQMCPDSDLDFLVEFLPGAEIDLWPLPALCWRSRS